MLRSWLPLLSLLGLSHICIASALFENTAVVRTIELGGSLVHVSTTYAVKALSNNAKSYTIAIPKDEMAHTSWLEAKVKGSQKPLNINVKELDSGRVDLIELELPKSLSKDSTINLVLETVQTGATHPWPERAGQNDEQALKYKTNLFVVSPYNTVVQRTKLRAPSPRIISYSNPTDISDFTFEDPATKSGATITYGPFNNVGVSDEEEFWKKYQQQVKVHYNYDYAVAEVLNYKRHAEVSHWGSNLNIEDQIHLHNSGPELRGHFSRLEHQSQAYFKKQAPQVIAGMSLHLPAGIRNVYYYDTIGNVSTSHLRTVPSVPKKTRGSQWSIFEMRPRYPILGGWNYSFTLGYDSPLADYAAWDKSTGKYILEVPLMTFVPGSAYKEAEIKIVLPEGATDVEYFPQFPPASHWTSTHTTYLDTVGRPAITLTYPELTDKHAMGTIFVTYRVPFSAHLRKPVAVATAFMLVFSLALFGRRVNLQLHK